MVYLHTDANASDWHVTSHAVNRWFRAYRVTSGRNRVATKTKLEKAIEAQVDSLSAAQRELVLSQFSIYKRNRTRLTELDSALKAISLMKTTTLEELRCKQAERSALTYEYSQLATTNSRISRELFEFLEQR